MRIGIIGAGYVGLTTAACLAEIGHEVVCADNDREKLHRLHTGYLPIFEPHLDQLVEKNREASRLRFVVPEEAIATSTAIFICVGTPLGTNGDMDLSAIEDVTLAISDGACGYRAIIQKSTVPVGMCRRMDELLVTASSENEQSSLRWDIIANPEFLREGSAVVDFLHPDRIVLGTATAQAAELAQEIYRPIVEQSFKCPIHHATHNGPTPSVVLGDYQSAELSKHAANSFLATKVSFINMVADLCEAVDADIETVIEALGLDSRIGKSFFRPGIGFGGACFPKDVRGFIASAKRFGCDFSLLREVEKINSQRVDKFVAKVKTAVGDLKGKRVGVWGLAFKPNTDDVRFAPSIEIVRALLAEGADVSAYDPQAMSKAKTVLPGIAYCGDPYQAAKGAEAVVLLTEWEEFRKVDWCRLATLVERPLMIDGRNALSASVLAASGFHYICIGRAPTAPRLTQSLFASV